MHIALKGKIIVVDGEFSSSFPVIVKAVDAVLAIGAGTLGTGAVQVAHNFQIY